MKRLWADSATATVPIRRMGGLGGEETAPGNFSRSSRADRKCYPPRSCGEKMKKHAYLAPPTTLIREDSTTQSLCHQAKQHEISCLQKHGNIPGAIGVVFSRHASPDPAGITLTQLNSSVVVRRRKMPNATRKASHCAQIRCRLDTAAFHAALQQKPTHKHPDHKPATHRLRQQGAGRSPVTTTANWAASHPRIRYHSNVNPQRRQG